MNTEVERKSKRPYRRITKDVISRFKAQELIEGNGSAAIEVLEPEHKNKGDKAWRIQRLSEKEVGVDYVPKAIQQISVRAIKRVGEIVDSTDEHIAFKASAFIVDHAIGKATQRTENTNLNINIESVLR